MGLGMKGGATLAAAVAAAALAGPAPAHREHGRPAHAGAFDHTGTFHVPANLRPGEPETTVTSAEIVDATPDGRTLVYTDSPAGRLGFVDVRRAGAPRSRRDARHGRRADERRHRRRPRARRGRHERELRRAERRARRSSTSRSHSILTTIPLAGQPDSIDVSPDRRYAAIVIENERDEDVERRADPAGRRPASLQILDLRDRLRRCATVDAHRARRRRARRSRARVRRHQRRQPGGGEPAGEQPPRHRRPASARRCVRHFSAGSATVDGIDAIEDDLGPQGAGIIALTDTLTRRREPDAVKWIDRRHVRDRQRGRLHRRRTARRAAAAASRCSATDGRGRVRVGRVVRARARARRPLPRGPLGEQGQRARGARGRDARAAQAAVRRLRARQRRRRLRRRPGRRPAFLQVLPTGIGPEGIRAIPQRGLLAVSAETDGAADGLRVRSLVTLYALGHGRASYPYVESADDAAGLPIPWVALSGLAGDPRDRRHGLGGQRLRARAGLRLPRRRVAASRPGSRSGSRSAGSASPTRRPATSTSRASRRGPRAASGWRARGARTPAARGRTCSCARTRPARSSRASPLPASLVAQATSSGFEGVAVTGTAARGDETVWAVIQREWADDPLGFVKLARYDVATGALDVRALPARRRRVAERRLGRALRAHAAARRGPRRDRRARRPHRARRARQARLRRRPRGSVRDLEGARPAARRRPQDAPARRARRPGGAQHLGARQARGPRRHAATAASGSRPTTTASTRTTARRCSSISARRPGCAATAARSCAGAAAIGGRRPGADWGRGPRSTARGAAGGGPARCGAAPWWGVRASSACPCRR